MQKYFDRKYVFSALSFYLFNAVSVYLFSLRYGQANSYNFFGFLISSVFYVLPYTLISFVLIGVVTIFLMRLLFYDKIFLVLIPLIFITIIDGFLFKVFFTFTDSVMVLIRITLLWCFFVSLPLIFKVLDKRNRPR